MILVLGKYSRSIVTSACVTIILFIVFGCNIDKNYSDSQVKGNGKSVSDIRELSEFTENITTYPSTPEIRIDCKDDEEKNKVVTFEMKSLNGVIG